MAASIGDYSYNKQQEHRNNSVPMCRIVLALVLFFWLSTHVGIARTLYQGFFAVSDKDLPIFILMNFIIFVLCFLSRLKQFQQPYVVYHDNVGGAHRSSCSSDVDSLLEEEHAEEMLADKHVILVENIVGEIVALSSQNSESFERNHNRSEFRRQYRGMSKDLVIAMREPPWRSVMDDIYKQ